MGGPRSLAANHNWSHMALVICEVFEVICVGFEVESSGKDLS